MKKMKMTVAVFLTAMATALLPLHNLQAAEPDGRISYSLPSTTVSLSVEAVQEVFHAGPYARYAGKYLGIDAKMEDEVKYHIGKVTMTPYVEADLSARHFLPSDSKMAQDRLLTLSSSGLVMLENGAFGNERVWRFPSSAHGDFSGKGVNSNLKSESATLFGTGDKADFNRVQQEMTVGKSLEQRAKEAAEMVLHLRETRIQIITGDTDATYSGEAMGAAIKELKALEREYLSLFIGYTETHKQYADFDVIPKTGKGPQMLIAFRLSDKEGLRPSSIESGRAIVMQLIPDKIAVLDGEEETVAGEGAAMEKDTLEAADKGKSGKDKKAPKKSAKASKSPKNSKDKSEVAEVLRYRVPVTCTVNIMEGTDLLLQSRIPVYQMGLECILPVK